MNIIIGVLLVALAFSVYMFIRNHHTYRYLTGLSDRIHDYNKKVIYLGDFENILDYNKIIPDYDKVLLSFWKPINDEAWGVKIPEVTIVRR